MLWMIVIGVIVLLLIVLFNKPQLKTGGISTFTSGKPPADPPPAPPPSDDKPA